MVSAQNQTRAAGNQEITNGHLLLGLLDESQRIAGLALADQGDRPRRPAGGAEAAPARGHPRDARAHPVRRGAKAALQLTFEHSAQLGHTFVGTEHILLALAEAEGDDGPLTAAGFDVARAEEFIVRSVNAVSFAPRAAKS